MSTAQLPQIPALPTSPAPTWEQRMRDFEARMSVERYEQAERAIAASQAVAAANTALRDVQEAARLVMVRQAEAAERMVELLQQAPPDAPPVVTPAGDEPALVALVASMTSTQRGNPVAAAAAAKAQLQAIRGA